MVKRTKKTVEPVILTKDEKIAEAKQHFVRDKFATFITLSPPTRFFKVGQSVHVGNLDNCVILEAFEDGKAYVIEYDTHGREAVVGDRWINAWYWCDIDAHRVKGESKFAKPRLIGSSLNSAIDSLYHMYTHSGIVCNPLYQRGYVWSNEDRVSLLDSIFDQLEIGSFTFVRNFGYHYKNDTTPLEYVTIDGRTIHIPRNANHTVEVIDGQQRLTTILRFMTDQFNYRGYLFSELPMADRNAFQGFSIMYRLIEAESVSQKDLFSLFLKVNRGVPQSEEHLNAVKKRLESM